MKATFKIFNITAFDPKRCTWIIDRYLSDQDLAIAQATAISKDYPACAVFVRGHKSRKDYDGVTLWEYLPEKSE